MKESVADWDVRRQRLAFEMFVIDCADVMMTREQAARGWEAMPRTGSGTRAQLEHHAGNALIVLEARER